MRIVLIGDNLGVVLALARGRSADFRMLCRLREICAQSLATGVRCHFRWVPSEMNVADVPSRVFETDEDAKPLIVPDPAPAPQQGSAGDLSRGCGEARGPGPLGAGVASEACGQGAPPS